MAIHHLDMPAFCRLFRGMVLLASLVAIVFAVPGCGKEEAGSSEAAPKAPTAAVDGVGDLRGSWHAPDGDNFIGLEVTKTDDAIVTESDGTTHGVKVQLLDGSRIVLKHPIGIDEIYKAKISRDALELEEEFGEGDKPPKKYLFRRLPSGTTVAVAHEESKRKKAEAAVEAERQRLAKRKADHDAASTFLSSPVLVYWFEGMRSSEFAFELKPVSSGIWEGIAYEGGTGQIGQWKARLTLDSLQSNQGPLTASIQLLERTGLAGEVPLKPQQFRLTSAEGAEKIQFALEGKSLKIDEKHHADIRAQVAARIKETEDTMAATLAAVGEYALFEGMETHPNLSEPRLVRLAFHRLPGEPGFLVAEVAKDKTPGRADFKLVAAVAVFEGNRAQLRFMNRDQFYLVKTVDGKPELERVRGFDGRSPQGTLRRVEHYTPEQLQAHRQQLRAVVDQLVVDGKVLAGIGESRQNEKYSLPISVRFNGTERKTMTATIRRLGSGEKDLTFPVNFEEGILGERVVIKEPEGRVSAFAPPSCTIDVTLVDGKPVLTSEGNGFGVSAMELAPVDDAGALAFATRLLSEPTGFVKLGSPSNSKDYFVLQVAADGKATGQFAAAVTEQKIQGPAPVTGQLAVEDGIACLKLDRPAFERPLAGGYVSKLPVASYVLYVLRNPDDTCRLVGTASTAGSSAARVFFDLDKNAQASIATADAATLKAIVDAEAAKQAKAAAVAEAAAARKKEREERDAQRAAERAAKNKEREEEAARKKAERAK